MSLLIRYHDHHSIRYSTPDRGRVHVTLRAAIQQYEALLYALRAPRAVQLGFFAKSSEKNLAFQVDPKGNQHSIFRIPDKNCLQLRNSNDRLL